MAKPVLEIIGLPPSTHTSDNVLRNSMPIAEIIPCVPEFSEGLSLFQLKPDIVTYQRVLKNVGIEFNGESISVAFLADNFPTDSFSNEYGETFLAKAADLGSGAIGDLAQMSGSGKGSEMLHHYETAFRGIGEQQEGLAGAGFSGMGALLGSAGDIMAAAEGMGGQKGNVATLISKLATGHRVDFPQVWKGSSFAPSYSMTIRLYNPKPGSAKSTQDYIITPLAMILVLGLPRTDDGDAYRWPFFHRVNCPGIWGLDPAVITNISVIKGGDQQQIAFNQKLGIVDLRLDFISLYNTLLCQEGDKSISNRPTLKTYLDSLRQEKIMEPHYTGNIESRLHAGLTDAWNTLPGQIKQAEIAQSKQLAKKQPGIQQQQNQVRVSDEQIEFAEALQNPVSEST